MSDETDKRRHYRPLALLNLKILPGGGAPIPAELQLATMDVAVGGMRCASNLRLDPDCRIRISLELIGGDLRNPETVVGDARVLRCKEQPDQPEVRRFELALEFVQMSPQDKKRLQGYLNSL
jgi:c-di-GMP-binding flagellar brake protein YcgR